MLTKSARQIGKNRMESFATLANLYTRNSRDITAFSALPDAPVQPFVVPRRRIARTVAALRRTAQRPHIVVRRPRYSAEC